MYSGKPRCVYTVDVMLLLSRVYLWSDHTHKLYRGRMLYHMPWITNISRRSLGSSLALWRGRDMTKHLTDKQGAKQNHRVPLKYSQSLLHSDIKDLLKMLTYRWATWPRRSSCSSFSLKQKWYKMMWWTEFSRIHWKWPEITQYFPTKLIDSLWHIQWKYEFIF